LQRLSNRPDRPYGTAGHIAKGTIKYAPAPVLDLAADIRFGGPSSGRAPGHPFWRAQLVFDLPPAIAMATWSCWLNGISSWDMENLVEL
jgi:hypothetical protein